MQTLNTPLSSAAPAVGAKPRWYRADNIRWILLFNVIAEHMLTQTGITYNWLVTVIVCWSRMITMPGFCFLSGYFSKKGDKCYQSAIFDFLVPYLIFNSLFVLIFGSSSPNIFTPTFVYWYLMCMFCWKLITKALQQFRYILPLSIIVALLVGGLSDVSHFLSLSRTICFLPFYLAGMQMSRKDVGKLENLPKIPVLIVTLVVMGIWGWLNVKGVYHIDFYYYWEPYVGVAGSELSMFSYTFLKGIILRALGYVISGLLIVFLFCLVPDRSLPIIRDGGTRTMVPYLLHTYFIMNMGYLYTFIPVLDHWYFSIPFAVIMGVFLLWLLGLPDLDQLYKDLINFIKKIFLKEPDTTKT